MSLARATIEFEWKRYLAAIIVMTATGVLFYVQAGLTFAQWRAIGAFDREMDADLIAQPINLRSFSSRYTENPLQAIEPANLYINPNILRAENIPTPAYFDRSVITNQYFMEVAVDTENEAMGFPVSLPEGSREVLKMPGYALISEALARQKNLGKGDVIQSSQFDDKSYIVGGVFKSSFDHQVQLIISRNTERMNAESGFSWQRRPPNILLRLKDKSQLEQTTRELESWLLPKGYKVITPEQNISETSLASLQEDEQLMSSFIVGAFIILVAIFITFQTLKSAIAELQVQFSTMSALGIGKWHMALTVMELALWTGLLSAALAATCAFVFQTVLTSIGVGMYINGQLIAVISATMLCIALLAGVLSLGLVFKVNPGALLR